MSIVECVPNVSEGNDATVIASIAASIVSTPHVTLLHTDSNEDANRTVFTFVGPMNGVLEAAFNLTVTACRLIDMRTQSGVHVRNGAVDVCPLIPIADVSIDECVAAARKLGSRIGKWGVPVYLYGKAASVEHRMSLAALRKGQYEALRQKLTLPEWKPDFGPSVWNDTVARCGSVQVGVRPFLIAFNVNLATQDVRIAKGIARQIRTSGYRGQSGEFSCLQADGWWMEKYHCAQITMNFTDYRQTPLHEVYQRIQVLAALHNTKVTGGELIGLIPEDALSAAGASVVPVIDMSDFSQKKELLIAQGIELLGLSNIYPFQPNERILEHRLQSEKLIL